jgi:hypothetical protein
VFLASTAFAHLFYVCVEYRRDELCRDANRKGLSRMTHEDTQPTTSDRRCERCQNDLTRIGSLLLVDAGDVDARYTTLLCRECRDLLADDGVTIWQSTLRWIVTRDVYVESTTSYANGNYTERIEVARVDVTRFNYPGADQDAACHQLFNGREISDTAYDASGRMIDLGDWRFDGTTWNTGSQIETAYWHDDYGDVLDLDALTPVDDDDLPVDDAPVCDHCQQTGALFATIAGQALCDTCATQLRALLAPATDRAAAHDVVDVVDYSTVVAANGDVITAGQDVIVQQAGVDRAPYRARLVRRSFANDTYATIWPVQLDRSISVPLTSVLSRAGIGVHSRVTVVSDRDYDCEPFDVVISWIGDAGDHVGFAFNTCREYVARHCVAGTFSVQHNGERSRYRSVRPYNWTLADVDLSGAEPISAPASARLDATLDDNTCDDDDVQPVVTACERCLLDVAHVEKLLRVELETDDDWILCRQCLADVRDVSTITRVTTYRSTTPESWSRA